jgi:hypothetical protein
MGYATSTEDSQPSHKKPYLILLKQQKVQSEANGKQKQTQLKQFFKPVNSYLDRSLPAPSTFEAS